MNEEIRCTTNNSDFLPALEIVYKKLRQLCFHTLHTPTCLNKVTSVLSEVINI